MGGNEALPHRRVIEHAASIHIAGSVDTRAARLQAVVDSRCLMLIQVKRLHTIRQHGLSPSCHEHSVSCNGMLLPMLAVKHLQASGGLFYARCLSAELKAHALAEIIVE